MSTVAVNIAALFLPVLTIFTAASPTPSTPLGNERICEMSTASGTLDMALGRPDDEGNVLTWTIAPGTMVNIQKCLTDGQPCAHVMKSELRCKTIQSYVRLPVLPQGTVLTTAEEDMWTTPSSFRTDEEVVRYLSTTQDVLVDSGCTCVYNSTSLTS